jgi:hypothetical protein
MAKRTYSYGATPAEVIRRECAEQCPEGYRMTLRSKVEWYVLAQAWNEGIDSYLEALTERSSADADTGKVCVHPAELQTLCRRLFEQGSDEAWSLRSCILETLGIEEV